MRVDRQFGGDADTIVVRFRFAVTGQSMGFEQLAALRAQLTREAKLKKQQDRAADAPAPAAKPAGKSAGKGPGKGPGKSEAKAERPARPARPTRAGAPARTGEKAPQVDPVVRVIGTLQKRFPAAFPKNPAPKVPLKVGILADLLAQASDLQLTEAQIREAVSTWCRGSRYWACLTDGAARVDLSGAQAGTVTARDAAFARNQAKGGPGGRRKGAGKPNASGTATGHSSNGQAAAVAGEAAPAAEHAETAEHAEAHSEASQADVQNVSAPGGEVAGEAGEASGNASFS
jgi:ProP effector